MDGVISDDQADGTGQSVPKIIVVMGVSGTGKSTLGTALAEALRLPFIDADDLHPPTNVAKMARGEPLGDVDRMPWLARVRTVAVAQARRAQAGAVAGPEPPGGRGPGAIVACSALRRAHRAVLRGGPSTTTHFVYLEGEAEVVRARLVARQGHFMKADMLESQLEALESPAGEAGVVTVAVAMSTAEQVRRVVDTLWS